MQLQETSTSLAEIGHGWQADQVIDIFFSKLAQTHNEKILKISKRYPNLQY